MKNIFVFLLTSVACIGGFVSTANAQPRMILVKGGTLPQSASRVSGQTVGDFQLGKYEVTLDQWRVVQAYAMKNGYDLAGIGSGSTGQHPAVNLDWFDAVKWCNALSEMARLRPVYYSNGAVFKHGSKVAVDRDENANGYRLPTEAEWEWAARGGLKSNGYMFSGGNDASAVSWNERNSSGAVEVTRVDDSGNWLGTWPVGRKAPNELGFHDMSGNVCEWCWDVVDGSYRALRGGGFTTDPAQPFEEGNQLRLDTSSNDPPGDHGVYIDDRGEVYQGSEVGLRVARNARVR